MRLLLVEDNLFLGDLISRSLERCGYAIDWAKNGLEADAYLLGQSYEVAIMDLGLPDIDGADVLRHLRSSGKHVPVLILSAREEVDERVRLLDLGADDYVVKPIALNELEARIRSLTRRGHGIVGPELTIGALRIDTIGRLVFIRNRSVELSARELTALEYIAVRAHRIVTKEQLLQALYGWQDDINSVNAVEKVISRLRVKLEGSGVTIKTVRGLGYSLETDEDQTT